MTQFITQLVVGVLLVVFTALITHYITVRDQKKTLTDALYDAFENHRQIYHRRDLSEVLKETKKEIEKDVNIRLAKMDELIDKLFTSLSSIKTSQAFIVGKLGGNANEYGLKEDS